MIVIIARCLDSIHKDSDTNLGIVKTVEVLIVIMALSLDSFHNASDANIGIVKTVCTIDSDICYQYG